MRRDGAVEGLDRRQVFFLKGWVVEKVSQRDRQISFERDEAIADGDIAAEKRVVQLQRAAMDVGAGLLAGLVLDAQECGDREAQAGRIVAFSGRFFLVIGRRRLHS